MSRGEYLMNFKLFISIILLVLLTVKCGPKSTNRTVNKRQKTPPSPAPTNKEKPSSDFLATLLDTSDLEIAEKSFKEFSLEKRCAGMTYFVQRLVAKHLKGLKLEEIDKCREETDFYTYKISLKKEEELEVAIALIVFSHLKTELVGSNIQDSSQEEISFYMCNLSKGTNERRCGEPLQEIFQPNEIDIHPQFLNAMYTLGNFMRNTSDKSQMAFGLEYKEYVSSIIEKINQNGLKLSNGRVIYLEFLPKEKNVLTGQVTVRVKEPFPFPFLGCDTLACLQDSSLTYQFSRLNLSIYRTGKTDRESKIMQFAQVISLIEKI